MLTCRAVVFTNRITDFKPAYSANNTIKNVQAYLGHKDVQTTLNYYVNVLDADKIATATVMGNVFAGAVSPDCSGRSCEAEDNVIQFKSIVPKKCKKA